MLAYQLATRRASSSCRTSTLLHSTRYLGPHAQLNTQVAQYHRLQWQRAAVVLKLRSPQTRPQSTSSRKQEPDGQRQRPPPPPKPTFRQILVAVLGGSLRNLRNSLHGQSLRTLFRQNPEELILALVWYVTMLCTGGWPPYLRRMVC